MIFRNRTERYQQFLGFLKGQPQKQPYVTLDPSSFAAVWAGKPGGSPTPDDELAFHRAIPNDSMLRMTPPYAAAIPALQWQRTKLREDADGTIHWQETLPTPNGTMRRIYVHEPGTTPWLAEPAVKSPQDLHLVDYFAEQIHAHADDVARHCAPLAPQACEVGVIPGVVILAAFEVYWLVDYPDMPMMFMDHQQRYMATLHRVHQANLAMADALAKVGFEMLYSGSAGLELLSPGIFHQAIVPFQREFNDRARSLDMGTVYHICGHSRRLIEDGIIDDIFPTVFETCSTPPCGDNTSLADAVQSVDDRIITKGNYPLEGLYKDTPDQIHARVETMLAETAGRRHIIAQADATIITGTPTDNLRAFTLAAAGRDAWPT